MIIVTQAYPRAGLIGNPSDGYHGKTIAFAFTNFRAEVTLYESPELEILPNMRDHSVFPHIGGLVDDVRLYGYYGGVRLLKATVKRFHDYCTGRGIALHDRNFTIRYRSSIPHMVGLAGSSAIITAGLRALMTFYGVEIDAPDQAGLILSVETDELGISAGLQDRVAQVYQGLVFMDFDRRHMQSTGRGMYVPMPPGLLPPLYIAYRRTLSEGSEVVHNDLRVRFNGGDAAVLDAVRYWAELTDRVRSLLLDGRGSEIGPLLNANFDRRAALLRISRGNLEMVAAARSVGASAKFTGSGGAVVGTCSGDAMFAALENVMRPLGIDVIRPDIAPALEGAT
ncbi:MAG: GHMP kinase [Lentisphaerae bacterium]|nr:GHMP kinase [Lentisphaerota bacterium]